MNKFISEADIGVEFGSGAGFAKHYIHNRNFKTSDLSSDDHLDYKGIDAQSTNFDEEKIQLCNRVKYDPSYTISNKIF